MKLYLLTGSNLGNSLQQLQHAKHQLTSVFGTCVAASSVYKTAPWGNPNQPYFYNQLLVFDVNLQPESILKLVLDVERSMGRVRDEKWGPRIIDIDVLFYNDCIYESEELIIPHPHIANRRFVLEPLCELAPDFLHPYSHKTMQQLLIECPDIGEVEKM